MQTSTDVGWVYISRLNYPVNRRHSGTTSHRETIKIVGTDIARLDNAAPDSRREQRETGQGETI